jgi:cyanophycinase
MSDPMVDPRGGAFTVGLGLVRGLAVVPGSDGELTAGLRRTIALAPADCPVVAIGAGAAIVREPDGTWTTVGNGRCTVFLEGKPVGLEVLAGKAVW